MPRRFYDLQITISSLTLGIGAILITLLETRVVLGQIPPEIDSHTPSPITEMEEVNSESPTTIEAESTSAKDLVSNLHKEKLNAQDKPPTESEDKKQVDPFTKTSGGQFRFDVTKPGQSFSFGLGSIIGYPDALNGPTRKSLNVPQEETRLSVISVSGHIRQRLGKNQGILLEGIADPKLFGLDFRYGNLAPSLPGAFAANIFSQSARSPAFENGEEDVDLANGNAPWVVRIGGGVEYIVPITSNLHGALGMNYQQVSIRDAAFTNNIESEDELGNSLTFSDDGQDTLWTIDAAFLWSTTDNPDAPTHGSRLRFATSQSIPVGDANILYNRLDAGFSQFIPLNLFGFTEGPRILVLNFQTGTFIGDVPSYQAFNLGGANIVRGFDNGEVGTSRSFIKTTAEYRFPIASLMLFKQDVGVGGNLFVDYANDLGTADGVRGNPADARGKPGDGLGYGLGLSADTSFGRFRVEFGLNSDGSSQFHLAVGDRY